MCVYACVCMHVYATTSIYICAYKGATVRDKIKYLNHALNTNKAGKILALWLLFLL